MYVLYYFPTQARNQSKQLEETPTQPPTQPPYPQKLGHLKFLIIFMSWRTVDFAAIWALKYWNSYYFRYGTDAEKVWALKNGTHSCMRCGKYYKQVKDWRFGNSINVFELWSEPISAVGPSNRALASLVQAEAEIAIEWTDTHHPGASPTSAWVCIARNLNNDSWARVSAAGRLQPRPRCGGRVVRKDDGQKKQCWSEQVSTNFPFQFQLLLSDILVHMARAGESSESKSGDSGLLAGPRRGTIMAAREYVRHPYQNRTLNALLLQQSLCYLDWSVAAKMRDQLEELDIKHHNAVSIISETQPTSRAQPAARSLTAASLVGLSLDPEVNPAPALEGKVETHYEPLASLAGLVPEARPRSSDDRALPAAKSAQRPTSEESSLFEGRRRGSSHDNTSDHAEEQWRYKFRKTRVKTRNRLGSF